MAPMLSTVSAQTSRTICIYWKKKLEKLTLKLGSPLADNVRQVLEVVSSSDSEATDKVLGRVFEVTIPVIHRRELILGPAEVGVTGDRRRTAEVLQSLLSLSLGVGIVAFATEVFIGRDTLLGAEACPGLRKLLICGNVSCWLGGLGWQLHTV